MPAEVKLFEVRDEGTTMPVIALKPNPATEAEAWCYARTGYGLEPADMRQYVLLAPLHAGEGLMVCDPYKHPGAPTRRTLFIAHKHIIANWDYLRSGDVVDVQFILGETTEPKLTERGPIGILT